MLQEKIKNILKVKKIFEKSYPLKDEYNVEIPLNIYQTWHTKKLPSGMAESVEIIKILNPRFNHYLFDDNDCREFIQNNFDPSVLHAYNSLIPGAYKADLWRYCILYIKGGLYLDIKLKCINGFKLIELTEKEHFVKDRLSFGIYNALMVCKAGNPLLLKAINKIVENVKNRYYGNFFLEPTGPKLLSKIIKNSRELTKNINVDLHHKQYIDNNLKFIIYNNFIILKSYHGHSQEKEQNSKVPHYGILWANRNIYK
jgi:mannosyltransferase OCH1-like enzyme